MGNVARGEWTEAEKGFRELLLEDKEDAEVSPCFEVYVVHARTDALNGVSNRL